MNLYDLIVELFTEQDFIFIAQSDNYHSWIVPADTPDISDNPARNNGYDGKCYCSTCKNGGITIMIEDLEIEVYSKLLSGREQIVLDSRAPNFVDELLEAVASWPMRI